MWYRVRYRTHDPRTAENPTVHINTIQAPDLSQAYAYVRWMYIALVVDILNVKELPHHEMREAEREHWSDVWRRAKANMPMMRRNSLGRHFGSPMALQLCLGYKFYTPNKWFGKGYKPGDAWETSKEALKRQRLRNGRKRLNWAGAHTSAAIERGYKPKDLWRRQALLKLAGPYGTLFARRKLKELGWLDKFPYWP